MHVFYTASELKKMKDAIDQIAKILKAARAKKAVRMKLCFGTNNSLDFLVYSQITSVNAQYGDC